MTSNFNIFAGAPINSPGTIGAGAPRPMSSRNALAPSAFDPSPAAQQGQNFQPSVPAAWLASAIGHAAALSDTPEKWAATIALLKHHGIDPEGYETFDKGRAAAIAASGLSHAAAEAQPSDGTE